MRELTSAELNATTGGVLPLIGLGLAVAGKATASSFTGWAIASASLILTSYQTAEHYLEPKLAKYRN